jgi:hypothetical protein
MYWLLVLYLTGAGETMAMTTVPEKFASQDACITVGQVWTKKQASHGTMGYACLPVER